MTQIGQLRRSFIEDYRSNHCHKSDYWLGTCEKGIFKQSKLCNLIDEGKDIKRNELEKENVNKLDESDIVQVNFL